MSVPPLPQPLTPDLIQNKEKLGKEKLMNHKRQKKLMHFNFKLTENYKNH